jgi:signal transduction histidine kinase
MSHQIYQIVKEALTNIQKHAEASRVIVKASVSADRITLELGDDGKGFNPQTPHSGFGLRGMQERVELLGGQLQIHTTPNRGTLIQVAIPYDSTASS